MTEGKPKKPFSLASDKNWFSMDDLKAKQIRDQDNAAPKPAPPQIFRLDHPRLAPPGMKGITRTVSAKQNLDININVIVRLEEPKPRPRLDPPSPSARVRLGDQERTKQQFKALASPSPHKSRER